MFRKKELKVYKDKVVTLTNYELAKHFYSPKELLELLYAFFMYYDMSMLGSENKNKRITVTFHNKKKRMRLKIKPSTKGLSNFFTDSKFIFVFLYVFFILLYSVIMPKLFLGLREGFLNLVQIVAVAFAVSCVAILIRLVIKRKFGKFSRCYAATQGKIIGNIHYGFINIYTLEHTSKKQFLTWFFHELDHVLWFFEGKSFDHTNSYYERPQEIRAYDRAKGWAERALLFELNETAKSN